MARWVIIDKSTGETRFNSETYTLTSVEEAEESLALFMSDCNQGIDEDEKEFLIRDDFQIKSLDEEE